MESSSKSDDVFNKLNLNPQLFIDQVIVTSEDLLDEAFTYYAREASTLVKADNPQKSEDLKRGVDQVWDTFQRLLDKNLHIWESFCLHKCFNVPKDFSLPNDICSLDMSLMHIDGNSDPDLDAQLNFLRTKIAEVGKESALLNKEIQEIQKQSSLGSQVSQHLNETLQLYEQHSVMFQELGKTGEQLKAMLQTKFLEEQKKEWENICNPNIDLLMSDMRKDFSDEKMEKLQEFLARIKNM